MNMWFWFFESRSSPSTAPLAMWLNGGPGCSSMIGLFQENGPCHFVNGASTPSLNPYSFNTYGKWIGQYIPVAVYTNAKISSQHALR
jgi:carboxypeptidase C (cathepsin A)